MPPGVAVGETALGIDFKAFLLSSPSNGQINIECEVAMVGNEPKSTQPLLLTTPQSSS